MAARIGALIAAVAMVVVAIAIRDRIDDKSVTAKLTCSTELKTVCENLGNGIHVTIEPAGKTLERLATLEPGADAGMDGWLVAGPWPDMVNIQRRVAGASALFAPNPPVLAASPLVAVVDTLRAPTLQKACPTPTTWACVAGNTSKTWSDLGGGTELGPVKCALPDPIAQAEGTNVLSAVTMSVFGPRPFEANDDSLRTVLRSMRTCTPELGGDAVSELLTSGGASVNLVFTSEVAAQAVLSSAANRTKATVIYPAPVTTANVVLGTLEDRDSKAVTKLTDALPAKAFIDAGWKAPADPKVDADPGVQLALRKMWDESK